MNLKYPKTSKTLLERLASGDEIGWDEFYERYHGIVLDLAQHKGLSESDAQDVLQEVMQTFFKQSKTFRFEPDIAKFRTFFGNIVRAKIADYYRKHKKLKAEEDISDRDFPDENDEFEQRMMTEWRIVYLEIAKQEVKQRVKPETWMAFELYGMQDRPVEKVAAYLDCSVNQVYQAKKHCVNMLRDILADLNEKDPELQFEVSKYGL